MNSRGVCGFQTFTKSQICAQVGAKKVFKAAKAIKLQHNGRVYQEKGRPVWATNLCKEGDKHAQVKANMIFKGVLRSDLLTHPLTYGSKTLLMLLWQVRIPTEYLEIKAIEQFEKMRKGWTNSSKYSTNLKEGNETFLVTFFLWRWLAITIKNVLWLWCLRIYNLTKLFVIPQWAPRVFMRRVYIQDSTFQTSNFSRFLQACNKMAYVTFYIERWKC